MTLFAYLDGMTGYGFVVLLLFLYFVFGTIIQLFFWGVGKIEKRHEKEEDKKWVNYSKDLDE